MTQWVTFVYFTVAALSFLVYGFLLKSTPVTEMMDYESVNRYIRIAFYVADLVVKFYILLMIIPRAIRTGNLARKGTILNKVFRSLHPGTCRSSCPSLSLPALDHRFILYPILFRVRPGTYYNDPTHLVRNA
ncbi:MAG: hypothetical protein R2744_09725 [Bacteroidales bacterium]